jgi:predicted AAA+ superfamily ATPase
MERVQKQFILKDLQKKLVIIIGPRQSGKTWLAKDLAKQYARSQYLNYDSLLDRKIIQAQSWLDTTNLLILDELHKMPYWKNYLKGVFDTKQDNLHILVTGSASLEIYNKLGDSLAGRYFSHRLLPLSLAELIKTGAQQTGQIDKLLGQSGFPEPFLAENITEANRWRAQYINSLLATDVFEFDKVQNIHAMRTIFELLRTKVGSPISYQSLAEDVNVSSTTVKKYIDILESLFVIFKVPTYSNNIARSLLKEAKIYFFDSGLIMHNSGAQLENLVAASLLKHVYAKFDYEAIDYKLNYIRTKEGKEVDFAIIKENKIELLIEVKQSNHEISKNLEYFCHKYNHPGVQLVKNLRNEYSQNNINVLKIENYLAELFM